MEDYRLTQSGQEVQDILNGAAMQVDLTAETERATEAEQTLQGNIDAEETRAQGAEGTLQDNIDAEEARAEGAEGTLQGNIDAEETRAKAAEKQNADDIDSIEEKIPSGASSSNKLATEEYVNDSVATATATFRGTYNVVTDLSLLPSATHSQISASLKTEIATADNNDYAFVQIPTSAETPEEIEKIERYKYNGSAWGFEYVLNNSGFTAVQWAAINSGITSNAVGKLDALPNNAELTILLNGKQDTLTFDNVPTQGSSNPVKSGGVYSAIKSEETRAMAAESQVSSAIEAILMLIPSAASALNQLADKAFVNSSIATATATFRGTYNLVTDLSLNVNATHSQIAGALGINISTADNNDYAFVQIPTSLETPTEIRVTERYKFNGTSWEFEYDLNNSGFTSAQWAAINSGITIALVGKLNGLPTNAELTTLLNGKQDTLTFDNVPTQGSDNPVKSSGIYNVIKAITDLIPAEATAQNQLADKADVAAKIVAAIPSWKGQYDALTDLQAVTGAKAGDMGCVKTTDSDGHAVLTFYQYSAQGAWVEYYTLRHYAQNKPATTGTTGDYPYNGMGRIELQKNIVNGVNTLTQAMMQATNTIYVIRYDFTLGEDIAVPENCVLEFDGGSISGTQTITGNNTKIDAQDVAIFKSGIIIAGTWICPHISSDWFNDITSDNRLRQLINLCSDSIYNTVTIKEGNYTVSVLDRSDIALSPKSNTDLLIAGTINMQANAFDEYRMIGIVNKENIRIIGVGGSIVGDLDNHDFSGGLSSYEWCHGIGIGGGAKNITVDGLLISKCPGDGIDVTDWADQTDEALNYDITIKNCEISYCGRQGVTLANGINNIVSNMYIHHIGNTTAAPGGPGAAIDIEPMWHVCENVFISNIKIANCTRGIMSVSSLNININVNNVSGDGITGVAFEVSNSTVRISNSKFVNTYSGIETGNSGQVIIENSEIHASTTYVIITWTATGSIYANKCKFINDTENATNVVLNLHYNTTIINSVLSAHANLSESTANNLVLKNNTINCSCYASGDNCKIEHNIINGSSTIVGKNNVYQDNTSYSLTVATSNSLYKNNSIVGNIEVRPDAIENEIVNNYIEGRVYIGVGAARTVLKRNNIKLTDSNNYAITFGGAADGSKVVENKVTSIVNFRGIYNVAGGSAAKEILHKGNIYDTTGVTVVMIDNTKVWRNYCEGGAANTNLPTTYLAIGDTHTGNDGKTVFYTPAGWKYADGTAI